MLSNVSDFAHFTADNSTCISACACGETKVGLFLIRSGRYFVFVVAKSIIISARDRGRSLGVVTPQIYIFI
jgi:hypothetical protein